MAKFALIIDAIPFPISVVASMAFGGDQSVVVYEAPGSDSGVVLLTGRLTQKRALNGKLIFSRGVTPQEVKTKLEETRDAGKIVTLVSPVDDGLTGRYVIENFSGTVPEGIESQLPFSMTLIEYRQANVKRTRVNQIALGPAERIRELLRNRNIVPS